MTEARSEHPSPISEGDIEEASAAARRIVDRESCHYTLLAMTNVEEVILIARALLSQRGRDEAIRAEVLKEAAKVADEEVDLWHMRDGNPAKRIAKHIRSLLSADREKGSRA